MKLTTKVIIFLLSITILSSFLVFMILKDNYSNVIKFENSLVERNIKNLLDNIYLSSEELNKTLDTYDKDNRILEALNSSSFDEELFERDNFTHLFLLDDNKNIINGGVYNRNSEELYYIKNKSYLFKNIDTLEDEKVIFFTTYDYEKILFKKIKIKNENLSFKYIIIGKSFDSRFLSFISRLSDNYISLVFNFDFNKDKNIRIDQNQYFYDIMRDDSKNLHTYLRLYDSLKEEPFYLSMNINRVYFLKIMQNNNKILIVFALTIIFLLILSSIFINKIFTNRIERIIKKIKTVSKNKELKTKIEMNYNDEITYLSNKINDMFVSLDSSQHEKLKRERDLLQSILDSQQNIVLITDGSKIKGTNKRFSEHFISEELFMSNLALLDQNITSNFLSIIQEYNTYERPAKIQVNDNEIGYYFFEIKQIDFKNYIIYMNDVSKLNKHLNTLKEKASFDSLTKIYNKEFIISIGEEWSKYKNFAIIVMDIDFFKKINDTYGHLHGDYILKDSISLLKKSLRESDLIGRFGGEEFIIYIENSNKKKILDICENLRQKLENHIFKYDKVSIKITASFGFSILIKNSSFSHTFKLADDALYEAKNSGRNKICYKLNT